jgi:hypothetical protein
MTPIASGLGGSDITSAMGDINGDGRLDVISTSSQTVFEKINGTMYMVPQHEVVWYQNDGGAAPSFTSHVIAVSDSQIPWVGVGDIDGNGSLDAVMEIGNQIWWYGNNGDGTVWTPHLVSGAQGDLSVWIADVNGDGHNDLILPFGNTITWWENVDGTGTSWRAHAISDQVKLPPLPPPVSFPTSPSQSVPLGDGYVSKSGTPAFGDAGSVAGKDISYGSLFSLTLAVSDSSLAVSVVWGGINILSVGDMNGDGKLDIISSGDGSIQWWENPGAADGTWTRHIVHQGTPFGDVRMAFAQDMNGDGELDIVSSGFGDVSWWGNSTGDGSTWVRHTITSNNWNAQSITVGDINGDGHPDLFSFAPMSSVVTWYENDGAANPSFTPHIISFPTGPGTVSLGDLNGDGRLDAVITPVFSNTITWFLNWDGQSPLPTPTLPAPELPPGSGISPPGITMPGLAGFLPPIIGSADGGLTAFAGSASTISNTSHSGLSNSAISVVDPGSFQAVGAAKNAGILSSEMPYYTGQIAGSADLADLSSLWQIVPPLGLV